MTIRYRYTVEGADGFERYHGAHAPDFLRGLYFSMLRIRRIEEEIERRYHQELRWWDLDDPELGRIRMQYVLFRLSATPGAIRWAGRPHGADTDAVLTELGLTADELSTLREAGAL